MPLSKPGYLPVGVGLDNIDVKAAETKKIRVINAPEWPTAVAELVIGLHDISCKEHTQGQMQSQARQLDQKRPHGHATVRQYLGIVGVGNIGRNIGRMAKALRMNLIGYDPYPISREFISETGMIVTDLNTLLESADFVTCHTSTPEDKAYV